MDYSKYLGIPYKKKGRDRAGLDCYGLIKLISEDSGNPIPEYDTPDEQSLVYQMYNSTKELFTKLDNPEVGCYVVFSIKPNHVHVGQMITKDKFIHILENKNVTIERLDNWFWSKKILGYYKWNK